MKNLIEYIKSNWYVILIINIFLLLVKDYSTITQTLYNVVLSEMMAIMLSTLAVYAYTKIDFLTIATVGEDGKISAYEQLGKSIILASIFLGVHLLVALVVFSIYFIQYSNLN
jgi:hypothetical protein